MASRVAVEAGFHELDAALVLVQRVVQAEPEVELVVQPLAVNAFPVGVVGKAVDLEAEIKSGVGGGHGGRRTVGQRRGEDPEHPERKKLHSRAYL